MRSVVYWDADAFLALINEDKSSAEMAGCNDVWATCEKGTLLIVTSTLTTAEVIHKKGTLKLDQQKRVLVSNFFRQSFISQKPLTREIAELARDVVWDSNIKPKDAVHVATCAYFKIRLLHSFDTNLVNKRVITVNGFPINVSNPHAGAQQEMPIEQA
ncbi:MAG: type II toxin-antitoxin system VapC family toxin [Sulfuriferula sp.]